MNSNQPDKNRCHSAIRTGSLLRGCLAMAVAVGAVGCGGQHGPQRHAVEGTVLFDGKPLASGSIRFMPTGGTKGPAAVGAIVDGFYEISRRVGPVAGMHRVEIEGKVDLPFAIDDERGFATAFAEAKTKRQRLPPQPVPEQFNRRSTLTRDISTNAHNKFDFELSFKSSSQAPQ